MAMEALVPSPVVTPFNPEPTATAWSGAVAVGSGLNKD